MQTQPHTAREEKKIKGSQALKKSSLEPKLVVAVQKWCHSLHCTLCLCTLFFRGKRGPDVSLPLFLNGSTTSELNRYILWFWAQEK